MENKDFIPYQQLRVAGLHTLSFFGYALHISIHALMAPGMDKTLLDETMKTMQATSGVLMMILWTVFTILPAIFAYVFTSKKGWQATAIIGLISVVLNGLHACAHIAQGDLMNGIITFLLQVPAAVIAVLWSFKLLKAFNTNK